MGTGGIIHEAMQYYDNEKELRELTHVLQK
jgi:hypothetical protein